MALSANFLAELANSNFRTNIVVSIDGTFFSKYQPDAGLVVDNNKIGLIDRANINGVTLDIRKANTPIASIGFSILDKNAVFSTFMGASPNQLQEAEVNIHMGFMTGSFDFVDYALLGTTRINNIKKQPNIYSISTKEVTDKMQRELLNTNNTLNGSINDIAGTLELNDATDFPVSGRIKIDKEFILYSGKTLNQLTGLSRGDLVSDATDHDDGDKVSLVTKKDDVAINILLDILLTDLAIDAALIDADSFTDLRDDDFSGDPNQVLYIYDIENALNWMETRLLESTNTRLFSVNGKITIGLLDQAPKFDPVPEINEDHIQGTPQWSIGSDKIVNKVIVQWLFIEGTQKFTRTSTFRDTDSIATYEERTPLTIQLYGVSSSSVVSNRANRILGRNSTPKAKIKLKTHFEKFDINVADTVRVTHRYLPQSGGTLGFNDTLEVMSKGVGGLATSPSISFGLEFTSYTGIRIGLISPSPKLDLAITNQKIFEVPNGTCYGVGYRLLLFDNVNNIYFNDALNTIEEINGNIITMADNWVTILGANVSLYFANYDDSNGDQRAQFAYTAPDTNVFLIDNSKAYEIIF